MDSESRKDADVISEIVTEIMNTHHLHAVGLMKQWAGQHGYEKLASQILVPVLEQFAQAYAGTGDFPLAQGYVAAKVAELSMDMIAAHSRVIPDPAATHKGNVVIGNIEDDFHSLGRRIVATFLKADGWRVHDIGNDVPAEEFVDKAVEIGAKVIGVSAMMYSTAINIRRVRQVLDARGLTDRIMLAVGGAVFVLRPELVSEVGADGTNRNAIGCSILFAELQAQAERWGVGNDA